MKIEGLTVTYTEYDNQWVELYATPKVAARYIVATMCHLGLLRKEQEPKARPKLLRMLNKKQLSILRGHLKIEIEYGIYIITE